MAVTKTVIQARGSQPDEPEPDEPSTLEPIRTFKLPSPCGPIVSVALGREGKRAFVVLHERGRTYLKMLDFDSGAAPATVLDMESSPGITPGFPRVTSVPGGNILFQSDDAMRTVVVDGVTGATEADCVGGPPILSRQFAVSADGKRAYDVRQNVVRTLDLTSLGPPKAVLISAIEPERRTAAVAANKAGRIVVAARKGGRPDSGSLIDPENGVVERTDEIDFGVIAANPLAELFVSIQIKNDAWSRIDVYSTADLTRRASCPVPGGIASTFVGLDVTGRYVVAQHWMVEFVTVFDLQAGKWLGAFGPDGQLAIRTALSADEPYAVMVGGQGSEGSVLQTDVTVYDLRKLAKP